MFVLHHLLFPFRGGKTRALNSECKADQDNFTDWMSFLPSNLVEEITPNPKALSKSTLSEKKTEKKKYDLGIE